jgi:LPXTG-motif cell wall-anchored protein
VRKVSAVLCSLFVMAVALVAMALPAGAGAYPPASTTPTAPAGTQAAQQQAQAAANLAFTGSDSTPLVIIGIVAVTLGAVLLVAVRRRGTVGATKAS